jgi:hypothetical protein
MLETIRQFGEEQLVARGEADTVRTAHARYFAEREADVLDNARPTTGSPSNWPTCAPRFDGQLTMAISTLGPQSRRTGRSWAIWRAITRR